jgi:hypothetical protein
MATETIVIRDPAAAAREETLREMRELRKKPLDRTRPGGFYPTLDGKAFNAKGEEIPLDQAGKEAVRAARTQRGMNPDPEDDQERDENSGTEPAPKDLEKMTLAELQTEATRRSVAVDAGALSKARKAADKKALYLKALGGEPASK